MDKFAIEFDERGCQLHNDYIGKIADGIKTYWERRGSALTFPELTYGMIHKDRKILEVWENVLKEENLL